MADQNIKSPGGAGVSISSVPLSQWLLLAFYGFLSGCIVGQMIDFAYPVTGSLTYHNPIWESKNLGLQVCWWIPPLYGLAAVILMLAYPMFDLKTGQAPRGGFNPGWGFTLLSIAFFIAQFYIGPYFFRLGLSNIWLFIFTVGTGILAWWIFDNTKGGLFMCFLTGILGPMVEYTMINVLNLYHYTSPDIAGLPLWIIGAYMCGTPANGNLARKYFAYIRRR